MGDPLVSINPKKYPELAQRIQNLTTVKEKLENNETEFNNTRQRLTNTFQQLQAPFFGKIPVGLDEAIIAFPVILSLGFLIYSYLLADAIDVRQRFYKAYKKKEPPIYIIAPIWIDPEKKDKHDIILRFIVISIPTIIFALTVSLIVYVWYDMPFKLEIDLLNTNYKIVYLFLYALGSLFFGCGYYLIILKLGYFKALIIKLKSLKLIKRSHS